MSKTNKWPSGPWKVDAAGDVTANGEDVAHVCTGYGSDVDDATSRLIAAAPDMYAALEMLVEVPELQGGEWERIALKALIDARSEQ